MPKTSLRKIFLFTPLSDHELEIIERLIVDRPYAKGTFIILEGEPGEALFLIRSGRIKIFKTTPDGREQILNILRDGSVFAEVVLFDGGAYPASAQALEDSLVGHLRNEDMEMMLEQHPMLAIKMLRIMGGRLRRAQGLIGDLALQDAYGRLAGLLLRAARQQGQKTPEGIVLQITLTRQEMANMVGTSRETVARILSRFQQDGALRVERQKFTILAEEKLQDWIN
jgi:CRP/FNR family transcriptional regulator, cyclic AMP receptor protein